MIETRRFPPPWSVEELDLLERAQSELTCYNLIGSGLPIRMGGLHDVAREASFEAKESSESRNGIGSCWGAVVGRRRIHGSRWYGGRYSNGEHSNYFR
jgi:hypothetical protein